MSKTLSHILTVFKVVRVIAKVVLILCIVGGVGCLIPLVTLPLLDGLFKAQLLGEMGVDLLSVYPACIVGLIACTGEAVFAFFAQRYCQNVLNVRTPFTFEGAKECFRLGLVSIIVSVAVSMIAGITLAVFLLFAPESTEMEVSTTASLSTGLLLLFLSLVFKHGAELKAPTDEPAPQEEQASRTEWL